MSRGLVLSMILLAVLAANLWYLVKNDGNSSLIRELKEKAGISEKSQTPRPNDQPSPKAQNPKSIPAEFQSGNSRFSQGSCKQDSDCSVGGCSGEVCLPTGQAGSSAGDVISTCEYSDSFPNAQGYSCGCLQTKVCGWQ